MTRAAETAGVDRYVAARLRVLIEMHKYARPAGGPVERAFLARWIDNLPGVRRDAAGNRLLTIAHPDSRAPRVLWSAHTDTVHHNGGFDQSAATIGADGLLRLAPGSGRNCLGADCTAGTWLLREMALAGRPGLYIWHAAEERGGIGSRWIARHAPETLAGIELAIAMDRRGTSSVVTHQHGSRTASDACAASIAAELARCGLPGYRADADGVFTDTASYADLVPECTNISTGTAGEHTPGETLDLAHVTRLRAALLRLDTDRLTVARDPHACDLADGGGDWSLPGRYLATVGREDRLTAMVRRHPSVAAELLRQCGITEAELAEMITILRP